MTDDEDLGHGFGLILEGCDDDDAALSRAEALTFDGDDRQVWPELALRMEQAGLGALSVQIVFGGSGRGKAVWVDNADDRVFIDVFVSDADAASLPASLVCLRYLDAALFALAAHFDAGPAPKARRTTAEEALEASVPPVVLSEFAAVA